LKTHRNYREGSFTWEGGPLKRGGSGCFVEKGFQIRANRGLNLREVGTITGGVGRGKTSQEEGETWRGYRACYMKIKSTARENPPQDGLLVARSQRVQKGRKNAAGKGTLRGTKKCRNHLKKESNGNLSRVKEEESPYRRF